MLVIDVILRLKIKSFIRKLWVPFGRYLIIS